MRFLEVPALITEDIEDPNIVDITEPITASISGTTLTIDGGDKVSGEATITLTGDVTVNTVTVSNIKQPSIHKITIKTNGAGNFTYVPNTGVTASSVSTTTKTGSDLDILLITTAGDPRNTYLDLDLADYVSPAANFSNALTGFNVSDLTSTYGTTAKLFKPDGTLLTTVNSAATGSGVNFGYTESSPGDVIYKLEVTDDVGRKSKYNLTRQWINYAMETTSTPGFQKFALEGNEYTSTVTLPSLGSSSKARVHKTTDHGYMGIQFRIQGRNAPSDDWVDIDDTGENENADESAEFLAFGNYLYHRVWVKPTAQASTTVSSSNVVTLTLSNVTEDVTTKTITGTDPFHVDETSNVFVFEETARIGTVPYTVTVGTETYTNAVTATTNEISIPTTPNTDFTAAGDNMLHLVGNSGHASAYMAEASGDGKYIAFGTDASGNFKIMKGDPETGYTDYTTATFSGSGYVFGSMSYDGKYIIVGSWGNATDYEIFKHDESAGTYTKLSTTYPRVSTNDPHTHKPAFVPRSGNYDFALTGTDNNATMYIKLYKHTADTDTWTGQTRIQDPTGRPNNNRYRGQFGKSFTRDGKYLMFGTYSTYGGYEMYTIDWDANTAVFSGANRTSNDHIGHAGAVTSDGKYVLLFHNDSNSRLIFKNNDAGDWSSATDVTSTFTFNNSDDDQGGGICFFGDHGQYYISRMGSGNVRIYKWLDVLNKEITLTYNGKDMLTLAHKGGLTTTSVKLYKDDVLYHTFGASETSVVLAETGVYQAIADEKYYSLKVTVTTITETQAELYLSHRTGFLLKKDGKVWYWGESTNGANATGNNTTVNVATLNDNLNALPSGIKQIGRAAVDAHCRCAITNDGKLYTWGYNGHGGLGRGNTSDYTSQGPWLVSTQSSNTFTFCHSSYYSNFALQDNGYLWSCGYNGQYVIGNGNNSQQTTFIRINLPNVIDFDCNQTIALALTSENKVYIWGTESNSSMGGASGTTGTPTHMTALDGKNIVKVRTTANAGYAISSDGKMYSWGKNDRYAVPDGTNSNVGTPTEMTWFSRKNIKIVDIRPGHDTAHLALDDQGNMYVWGKPDNGVMGDGPDMPGYSWPIHLRENIASISCGYAECGCIDKFGQVYTWGDAQQGQQNWIHGSNSDTDINIPTSNNLSVGSSVVYDGFDKYLLGKDSTVTSNVTFGSNTVSLGTKSEVFISDPHTYKFKIMESGKTTYTSTVISSTPTRPTGRVYPPKSGTHKNHTARSTSANTDFSWNIDGALYGSGDYTASCSKSLHSNNGGPFDCFNGLIDKTSCHLNTGQRAPFDIQLHMPQKIKLTKYAMYNRSYTGEYNHSPKDWKVYGSNDKTNWTELDSQTNQTVTAWGSQLDLRDTKREYTVTGNTKYFSSYKLDISATGTSTYGIISQIEYYGDEEGFLSDDGFGKLTLDVKGDTDATSNIVFHSNTYAMGAARDLYITDTGEYSADIFGSNKHFLGSKTHTVSANATELIWKENEDQILYGTGLGSEDRFGMSVKVNGDYAIVGTPYANEAVSDAGAAYIFYKSGGTWTQQAILTASDAANNDQFGNYVDIDGDYAIVGAYNENSNTGAAYIFKRSGTSWTQQTKLTASNAGSSDEFGRAVGISGDYAFVGARREDTGGTDRGSAYIFKRSVSSWSQQAQIQASDAQDSDNFGWSLSVDGDYAIVGAYLEDTGGSNAGSAYIFKKETIPIHTTGYNFPIENLLTGGNASYSPRLWYSKTVNTNEHVYLWAYDGIQPSAANFSTDSGGISYKSDRTPKWQDYRLGSGAINNPISVTTDSNDVVLARNTNLDNQTFDAFRFGNTSFPDPTESSDSAYEGWSQQAKIQSSDIQADDRFGVSVDIDGEYAIIGANGEDTGASNVGAAYIFKKDTGAETWTQQAKLQASDKEQDDKFGGSDWGPAVSISGNIAVIGAHQEDTGGANSGAAYIFERSGTAWTEVKKITASDAQASDEFGTSVGIDGNNVIVGAYLEDTKGSNAGAAYIFSKAPKAVPTLNFDGYNKLSIDNVSSGVGSPTSDHFTSYAGTAAGSGGWSTNISYKYGYTDANGEYVCNRWDISGGYTTGDQYQIKFDPSSGTWSDVGSSEPNLFSATASATPTTTLTGYPSRVYLWYNTGLNLSFDAPSWAGKPTAATTYTIKKDDAAFATTTSNTVYIRDTGTYTAEVKGSGAYVTEVSKVVSGSISGQNASNAFVSGCGTNLYAVTHDGKAYATGRNHTGQLADGTTTNSNTWKHISSLTNVVDIGGGSSCIAACQSDGTVYAWGDNNSGQLGQGNTTTSYVPLQVKGVGGSGYLTNISAVGGGASTMFYITSAGALYACGNGGDGQLGQGNTSNSSTPVQVKGVGGTGYLTNIIKAEGANADNSVIALSSTGTVYTWGWNGYGQAGLGNTTEYHTPQIMQDTTGSSDLTNIVDIASTGGGFNIMLSSLASGGYVYGAGYGGQGQLGDNSTSNRSTVVQMKGVGGTGFMENIVDIDAGGHFTIMCDSSGYVYCVGYGGSGALGQGNTSNSNTPLKVKGVGGTGYLENIIKVHADDLSSLALSSTGKLYGWGRNNYGNLGDGTETERHTPIEIPLTLFTSSPSVTYDGKNKLTVGGTNYADTSTVTYYSNTYELGTAKTMYVKDVGEYVFKISGTDKYAESNVYVSSVDLAGATTKPISFDGYNKLTLISPGTNAVSNVTYFSNTYDMGSASTFYIKDTGTYDLEMSGSNVFALSSNTVPGPVSGITVPATMSANSSGGNTASSSDSSANAWKVFDGSDNTNYSSPEDYHWDSPHQYTGSSSLGGVNGTWIKIQVASAITPVSVFVKAKPDNQAPEYAGRPQQWRIMGSTDNTNWTQLHSSTTLVDSSSGTTESFNNTTAYTYFAIVVTHKNTIAGGGGNDGWQISRLSFTSADAGGISEPAVSGTHRFTFADGSVTDENNSSISFNSGGSFGAADLRNDGKTSCFISPGSNKTVTIPAMTSSWCINFWMFHPYCTWNGNTTGIPSDFSSYVHPFGYNWHSKLTFHMDNGYELQLRSHWNWIMHLYESYSSSSTASHIKVNSLIGSGGGAAIHGGNNSDNVFLPEAWHHWAFEYNGTTGDFKFYLDGNHHAATTGNFGTGNDLTGITWGDNSVNNAHSHNGSNYGSPYPNFYISDIVINTAYDINVYNLTKGTYKHFLPIPAQGMSVRQYRGEGNETSVSSPSLTFDTYNKLTVSNFTTTDKLWPPSDGTWSISTDTSTLSEWTISGASYGNGSYKATSSVATNGSFKAYQAFEGTESGNTSTWQILATAGILSIELPESVLINKYALLNRNYNLSEDEDASPKDFTFEGSSDGSTWVTLDTVTGNGYYTAEGTASQQTFTMSNTTAYKHYRLNVTANNGDSGTVVGELKLLVNNPRTGTLTDPYGATYALGQTQDTIYIHQTGNYTLDVTNNDQKAIMTKNVGTISTSIPPVTGSTIELHTPQSGSTLIKSLTCKSPTDSGNFSFSVNGVWATNAVLDSPIEHTTNSNHNFTLPELSIFNNNKNSRLTQTGMLSGGTNSSGSPVDREFVFEFENFIKLTTFEMWDGRSDWTYTQYEIWLGNDLNNLYKEATVSNSPTSQWDNNNNTNSSTYSPSSSISSYKYLVLKNFNVSAAGLGIAEIYIYGYVVSQDIIPQLTFDTYNKLTLTGTDSDATSNICYYSNTYEMGSRKELLINDYGAYYANIYSSNTLALVKKEIIETSYSSINIAFHHGAFNSSDYSSAYSTVSAAATAGHVYSDTSAGTYTWGTLATPDTSTSGQTGYTWTPTSTITADVLMAAGGGGGGGAVGGGGGGAGGLLHHTNQTISSGQKTIVVGNGGTGGVGYGQVSDNRGENGKDTTFTGLTTVVGGGGGGANTSNGVADVNVGHNGGSGGGGGYGTGEAGGTGTSGQGYGGGEAYGAEAGGGGGGAGSVGVNGVNGAGGNGGTGVDKSSIFGTTYGDSGWFASGGGAGGRASGRASAGTASQGGGSSGKVDNARADDAQKHTGGGGGGGGYNSANSAQQGGNGGSGIVIIKSVIDAVSINSNPTATYNTISNIDGTGTKLGASHVGYPISFNASGTRVVIGEYNSSKAHIYDKVGGSWTLSQTWTESNTFGKSCAMSDDGNVVVVVNNDKRMSLYVYENGSWVTKQNQTQISNARDTLGAGLFMSGDGLYLLVTDYSYEGSGGKGRNKIFDISEYSFLERHNHGFSTNAYSWNGDIDRYGNRAIYDDGHSDYWHVYKRSGASWSSSTTIAPSNTTGRGPASCDENMVRVALSDGSNSSAGVTIWYRDPSGDTFALEQTITVDNAGCNISMNYAGDRVMITDKTAGDIEIWTRSGTTWTKQKTINPPTFGTTVNYSHTSNKGDGYTLATVDETYDSNKGRVYIYSDPPPGPSLTFDGYNKLTPPVLEATFTATRLSDWDNNNQSKTTVTGGGDWPDATMTHHQVLQNGDKSYQNTNGGASRDAAQLFTTVISGSWGHAAHGNRGTATVPQEFGYKFTEGKKTLSKMILTQPPGNSHTTGNVSIKYWDGSAMVTVSNQSPTGMSSLSYNSSTTFTFDSVPAQYWQIDCYASSSNSTTIAALHAWQLLSGRDPVSTVLTKGSDSYDIGTASKIYIDAVGTYDAQAKNSNTFVIKTSKVVSGSITRSQIWKADGTEDQILYSSDAATYDAFGERISIDGNYAVVGARQADPNGTLSGAAYVFYKSGGTWSQQQKLVASDSSANYEFGYCVDISGDTIVVGSGPYDGSPGSDSGKVYVFKRTGTTWTQQAAFQSSDIQTSDYFGWSVSIHGDYIIAGARNEDTGGSNAGSAYIFKRDGTTWSQQAKIQSKHTSNDDNFGSSVSIHGDYAIIAAYLYDEDHPDVASNRGTAYIFKREQVTGSGSTYPPSAMTANSSGGYTTSASSTNHATAFEIWKVHNKLVGNEGWHGNSSEYSSSTRNFTGSFSTTYDGSSTVGGEWIQLQVPTAISINKIQIAPRTLTPDGTERVPGEGRILGSNDGSTWSSIGTFTGKTYTTGTYTDITFTQSSNYTYFRIVITKLAPGTATTVNISEINYVSPGSLVDQWTQQIQLQPSDPGSDDHFGGDTQGVDIHGDYAVVGARLEDTGGSNAGAAYVFKKTSTTLSTVRNPYFTAYDAIETNSNWSSSTGFQITESSVGASRPGYHAFDNTYTADNSWESTWLSGSSMPAWVQIQYPEDVVIKSYTIVGRDDTNRYYPTSWQLQGATAATPSTYINLETTGGNRTASSWAPLAEVSHDVNTPNTAYRYFRLYVNSSNENNQVSINELKLFTTPLSGQSATVDESWSQQAKLQASDVQLNSEFGGCVSISGDRLVVGANADDRTATDAGAAYIFERSGTAWTEVKKITASDAQASDSFGCSVAIDGTNVIVGARSEDTKGTGAGAAYVYEKVYVGPNLTYDNSNKLSLTGVSTSASTNLTFGSVTTGIGAAKDVYIKDQGTYKFHTNDGSQSLLMSKTVSSDPSSSSGAGADIPLAFHHGTFADSDDPHSDGSVSAAATNGHVYSDTPAGTYSWGTLSSVTLTAGPGNFEPTSGNGSPPSAGNTVYKWTPSSTITNGRTLVVAGGGGGGADMGGGGGAGGLLASTTTNIAKEEQTITVGDGGTRGHRYNDSNRIQGGNGADSSISGPGITAIGGGGGATAHNTNTKPAGNGGSGGGGSGGRASNGNNGGERGTGTAGQGNDGARSGTHWYPAGGGGAGGKGYGRDGQGGQNHKPHGGDGLENDILGTSYWFSGGGGGASHSNHGSLVAGDGGKGGGGGGAHHNQSDNPTNDTNGLTTGEIPTGTSGGSRNSGGSGGKHTGGGGGGSEHSSNTDTTKMRGGRGGSGIVVIMVPSAPITPPSQVYDNTKTITVSNIPSGTSTVGKIYKGATAYTIHATEPTSNVIIKNTGSYVSVFTTSSTAYLTNTVNVNATPTTTSEDNTIEDEAEETTVTVSKTIAFHDGTFADSDDPHSDGSITAAATAGHVYSDTATGTYTWGTLTSCVRTAMANNEHSTENWAYRNGTADPPTAGFTTYKWTPPGAITNGRTLVVAGGGGGGTDMAGGGGAGGLLASTTTNIAHTEQTIQVGGPGSRGYSNGSSNMLRGGNGADSSISGPGITAIGGGGGATKHNYNSRPAGNGGSGGGGSGGRASNGNHGGERGTGTAGQGFDGARSGIHWYPGGGGGAGEKGYGRDGSGGGNSTRGDGGNGLEDDILGTSYWWAGGGGGNGHSGDGGHGGKGGGGGGSEPHHTYNRTVGSGDTNGITNGNDGEGGSAGWHTNSGGSAGKHTGGGGGGGDHHDNSNPELMRGGLGGSGIVAIKFTAQGGTVGIPGSTAVPSASSSTTDAPSDTLVATTEVATPTMNLDFTASMTKFPRTLKRYNNITSSSIGARFNRTDLRKKRVHKSINTDTFSIELTANNMGDSSSSSSTLPVTVVNSGAGTQYTSGWTTGSTSSFVVPSDAPNTLYYYCQNHNGMGGSISVSSASTTTHTVTVVSSSAGTQYTSGWTASGTPGSSGGINTFIAPSNAPSTLYYYCGNHSGMGGAINMVSGPVSTTFAVTVSSSYGSNYFYIDGTQQATISLVRGKTYTFNNNASGSHPMYFATSSDGTTYTSGVTGSGSNGTQYTSGWTIIVAPSGGNQGRSQFSVPANAPNTLYYYCGNHSGMGGAINVVSGPASSTFAVTVQSVSGYYGSSNKYFIDGTQQATISLVRGKVYTFNNNASGSHPMHFSTSSDGTSYTLGVTNGGSSSVTFSVPSAAPNTLYYKCGVHGGMGGTINIIGPVFNPLTVTVQSVSGSNKYFIDGVQQDTLQLVRGETYVFNQENSSNGTHPLRLSTTSNGTHDIGGSSTITFAVPLNAPTTLYYKCGNHGGMGGTINILGPTASPLAVMVTSGKFVIGGVSQATLQLVRGETYVFDQTYVSNSTHPLRLSTTSNGTHVIGGSGFYIGGTEKPTLSMVRGNTYTFDQTNASNGSHVLQIASASDGTQYTTGYTTGTFVVPLSAPDTLYYKSSTTAGMGGLINITGSSTSAFIVTASGGKFSIGGVQQASLSVIRGLTYTFDQTGSSNSTHVLLLSSTSDGTRNTGVNKYYISGVETPTLTFIRGNTYTFDQSDSTNGNHPIRLSATSNGTHASGSQYTSGWTTTGTPGSSSASSQFIVPANAPSTLYYYCQHHSGMGGASSINVADSNSGILLTYGTHALVANSTVSGEYTIATNFDGTTSNLYVGGELITQTTPTIASGAKMLKIGEDYNGFIKNLKFWNYAKRFYITFTIAFHHGTFADSDDPHSDGSITAAATAGHIYSDTAAGTYTWGTLTSGTINAASGTDSGNSFGNHTPGNTTYKWTPPGTITGARMLLVGGGGGGGMDMGGGGGAGGFLAIASKDISVSEQTVVVGQGGYGAPGANETNPLGQTQNGGHSYNTPAYNGGDSSISGETAYGGGRGGHSNTNDDRQHGGNGGSGGGVSGYDAGGGSRNNPPGTGVSGQGNAGGGSNSTHYSGGGGGAGEAGTSATSEPKGGDGLSSDILGTEYWWSGGGGGSGYSSNGGDGGKGGGGGGAVGTNPGGTGGLTDGGAGGGGSTNSQTNRPGGHAGKHTGGGGGGGSHYNSNNKGGNGGSGIVIIKI